MRLLDNDENWQKPFNKTDILKALRENLGEHQSFLEEAREGYRKKVVRELADAIDEFEAGGGTDPVSIDLSPPSDHSKDYETVIGMLDQTTDSEIILSPKQYRTFVMNDWDWAANFLRSNAGYSQAVGVKASLLGIRV